MLVMLKCVAEAIAAKGVKGLAEIVPGGNYLFEVAAEALKRMRDRKRAAELRAEVLQMAQASTDEAKRAAAQVAREVAGGKEEDRVALELYLTQIPAAVRQSLKRADDPSGRSVPNDFNLNDPADLLKRLPTRAPTFRPGDPLPGRAGWQLVELLGAGGFGEVWLARNPSLSALKGAVKFGLDPQARDRLLRHEGALVNRVMEEGKHPNVVQLLDAHLEGDAPWLMYEYVPGGDLTGLIFAWQQLPAGERAKRATAALRTLAAAVGHFHRLRPPLVHRDLKPANILVNAEFGTRNSESKPRAESGSGSVLRIADSAFRITDFGIGGAVAAASLARDATRRSSTGYLASQLWGSHTPLYASPQQQRGEPPDPRDDVHALGVIGFQMLTGKLDATLGADYAKTLRRIGVPEPLIELLGDCAAHDPDNRPRDAAELADRLAKLDAAPPRPRAKPVPPPDDFDDPQPVSAPGRTAARLGLVAGGLVALALLAGGYFLLSGGSSVAVTKRGIEGPARENDPAPVEIVKVHEWAVPRGTAEIVYAPDGKRLATVTDAGTVAVWDAPVAPGDAPPPLVGGPADGLWRSDTGLKGHRPAFHPSGTRFATADSPDDKPLDVMIFATGTGIRDHRSDLADRPLKLAYSPDGRWLAAGGATNGEAKVWAAGGAKGWAEKTKAFPLLDGRGGSTHEPGPVVGVEFAGTWLLTAGGLEAKLWDASKWDQSVGFVNRFGHSVQITSAAIVRRGAGVRVAAGGWNGKARVWDHPAPEQPFEWAGAGMGPIVRVEVSAYRHAAALDDAGVGAVWTVAEAPQTVRIDWHGSGRVTGIAFNPSGRYLATCGEDGRVCLWDGSDARVVRTIDGDGTKVTAIAFSPDGNHLAAAAGEKVVVWRVPNPPLKGGRD